MAGVPKGYRQSDVHRLRIKRTMRSRAIERLDARYVERRNWLKADLARLENELMRAEVLENAAKAAAEGDAQVAESAMSA